MAYVTIKPSDSVLVHCYLTLINKLLSFVARHFWDELYCYLFVQQMTMRLDMYAEELGNAASPSYQPQVID